jgi:hypothetical protein
VTAVQVRPQTAAIPDPQPMLHARSANSHHFQRQFVTENARVRKKGLGSGKSVQIGAADADPMNTNLNFIRAGGSRQRHIGQDKVSGFGQCYRSHGLYSEVLGICRISCIMHDILSKLARRFNTSPYH